MSEESPDWRDVFADARAGSLGASDDDPIAKGALVSELRSRAFADRALDRAVDAGVLEVVEQGFPPKYELVDEDSQVDIAADDLSTEDYVQEDRQTTADYSDADWSNPEPDVWADSWAVHRFWMARQGKLPYAPWGDPDHPDTDPDGSPLHQWSITEFWRTKDDVDEWVEMHPDIDGYACLLEKEDDPYTDDPDPFGYVDGDDVRCPETGKVHPEFIRILKQLGLTYCEVSQSGAGVHGLYEGALPDDVKQASFEIDDEPWGENEDPPSVEIYDGKKVCAVTGEHVPGTSETVEQWDDDSLEQVLDEHLDEDDRVDDASHDTDSPDLDGYEPSATSSTEETDDIRDIYAAIDRLDPSDLPLRTRQVGEEATGWETWDPSTYRPSSSGESLHRAPRENKYYDHDKGQSFGLLGLWAYEQEIISKPWSELSGSDWWDAVEAAREAGADIPVLNDEDDEDRGKPVAAIPNLDHLQEDERRRAAKKRGVDYPSTEEARRRLEDRVIEAVENDENVVVDAPTALGKSYTVATQPWRGIDGQPVVQLHATRDARDEAYETSKEHDVKTKRLRGRKEACPVARGDYDPDAGGIDDDDEITVHGTPASEWFDAVCDRKGIPFSTAHKWLQDHVEGDLPCCPSGSTYYDKEEGDFVDEGGECPAVTQWEDVPRTEDGEPTYDVIHATHAMAHVPSLTMQTNVVFDEQPDFSVEMPQDRIRRAVTAYLKEIGASVRSWECLVQTAHDGFSGNEHANPPKSPADQREEFLDALDDQPDREWYIECDDAHVLAPALAKAVYYAEERGNGRRAATVPFEPPTLYAHAHDEDDWNRQWLTVVLDEDNTVRSLRNTPSLGLAQSVIGLDAHPAMPLWNRVHPSFDHDRILDTDERRLWRRYERGLHVVQVGDATRPLSGDNARDWFGKDRVEALVKRIDDVHGDELRTGLTAMGVEDLLQDCLDNVSDNTLTMHYGEEKSRNDFADESVGVVNGCIDPGDGFVLDLLAELDLDARPRMKKDGDGDAYRAPGREFVGEDAETAQEILASVRENHVAQAAGRYARDADSDDEATVYVRTDAVPVGFADEQVPGVAWAFGEKQQRIVEYLRDNPGETAREIAGAVDASKRHVQKTLRRLADDGLVTVREAAAKHGADVFGDIEVDSNGVVELECGEITNSAIWESCMWEFAISDPDYAHEGLDTNMKDPINSSTGTHTGPDTSIGDFTG